MLLLIRTWSHWPLHSSGRYLHVLFLDYKVLIQSCWWLWDWLIMKSFLQDCKMLLMWWVVIHFLLLRSALILCITIWSLSTCPLNLAILDQDLLLLLMVSRLFILWICGMIVPVAILIWIIVKRGASVSLEHIIYQQRMLLRWRYMW